MTSDVAGASDEAGGWRRANASRLGWLVDGEAYFGALHDVLPRARREILIVGWDIDSNLQLVRDGGEPAPGLCQWLDSLLEHQPDLHINVLSWDFAAIYMLERELLASVSFGWRTGPRLHFKLDDRHATGASHHQKLVVVDGALAFVGGFDLTKCRWDRRAHAPDDPGRCDSSGSDYRPFHDVQAVVTGPVAADLRALAAGRWQNATGKALPDLEPGDGDALWPERAEVRASDTAVTIARTWCNADGGAVREVLASHLERIRNARRWIYLENQYFTSAAIVDALAERLSGEDPPELLVVLPLETAGWLEQKTMEMLRDRAIARLREADRHQRFRVVGPVSGSDAGTVINVHSKVTVIDGRWLRIGSANLSNRSMSLDSECDIITEAPDAALALVADLLSEHLGARELDVADVLAEQGLLAVLDRFGSDDRRLLPVRESPGEFSDLLKPLADIADMEQPMVLEDGAGHEPDTDRPVPATASAPATPLTGWLFVAVAALILAGWLYATMHDGSMPDPQALLEKLRGLAGHPLAPLVIIAGIVAGSLVVAPITAMIALCALLLEPWLATLTALAGTLIATALIHWIGTRFGGSLMRPVPDAIVERVRRIGHASDAWSLAALRLIPIAPFSIINLAAGAAGVERRALLLGTLIGMGPGILLICLSVDRARAALSGEALFDPVIIGAIAAGAAALIGLRWWFHRRDAR